jgi:2-keto-4-pentenoate hydratase
MTAPDPLLLAALRSQLSLRRAALDAGAARIGWKLGMGDRERIGTGPVVGHLTSATVAETNGSFGVGAIGVPRADVEVAIEFGRPVDPSGGADAVRAAAARFGVALEICDLGGSDDAVTIVASNVFHRAVVFGPFHAGFPPDHLLGSISADGHALGADRSQVDLATVLVRAAQLLDAVGERIAPGDIVITGSIVQVPARDGQTLVAELDGYGSADLTLAI